jgi:hypothetical protein
VEIYILNTSKTSLIFFQILAAAIESSLDISTPSISSLLNISIPGPEVGESQDGKLKDLQ